jgi:hypothetical protein
MPVSSLKWRIPATKVSFKHTKVAVAGPLASICETGELLQWIGWQETFTFEPFLAHDIVAPRWAAQPFDE